MGNITLLIVPVSFSILISVCKMLTNNDNYIGLQWTKAIALSTFETFLTNET